MANIPIKDGNSASKFTKATGAGTDLDPFIPQHLETNSATIATNTGNTATSISTVATNTGDTATRIGATSESAAGSDTATSGLNGLIKRLLARVTTLLGVLPAGRGEQMSMDSLSVTFATESKGSSAVSSETLGVWIHNSTALPVDDVDTQSRLDAMLRADGAANNSFSGVVASWTDGTNVRASSLTYPLPIRVMGNPTRLRSSATFTRLANTTAYTAGDIVGPSAGSNVMLEFTSITAGNGGHAVLTTAQAAKSTAVTTSAAFRLHLFRYDSSITFQPDNDPAQFALATFITGATGWMRLGHVDFIFETTGSSTMAYSSVDGLSIDLFSGALNTSVGGVLTALQGYTPGSAETFHIQLTIERSATI